MGNGQVGPAPSSSSDAEEVTQFLCARIPRLECYTTKEPTFKDCFTARESWANLTKEKSRSYPPSPTHAEAEKAREEKAKGEEKAKEEKEEKGEEEGVKAEEEGVKAEEEGDIKEELTPDSDTSGDMAFFSLFFKKLETLHPESKLIPASAEGGYLLDSLISILLMGATSVHAVEKFLEKYSYVGLSEYGYIGEALIQTLDVTISRNFEDSSDGDVDTQKKNTSAEISIVRAWNRIYSRFLRYLAGTVSSPSEIPDCLQRLVAIPEATPAKPQFYGLMRGRSSSNPTNPTRTRSRSTSNTSIESSRSRSPPSCRSLGSDSFTSLCSPVSVAPDSVPDIKSTAWLSSDKRMLGKKLRKAHAIHTA